MNISLRSIIIVLGVLVAVMPHLGFPDSYDKVFFFLTGVFISLVIYFSQTNYCNTCGSLIPHMDLPKEVDENQHSEKKPTKDEKKEETKKAVSDEIKKNVAEVEEYDDDDGVTVM